jgi:hypothetical protein
VTQDSPNFEQVMQDVDQSGHRSSFSEHESPTLDPLMNSIQSPITIQQNTNSVSLRSPRPSSDVPACPESVEMSGPAPLLQFDWNQSTQFDLSQEGFDFLTHSNDVNVQLQRLMDMSFLSPLEAELAPSPFPRQPLPGSHLSVLSPQNLMSYERSTADSPSTPPSSGIWKSLEKGRWAAQVEKVRDEEQVVSLGTKFILENLSSRGVS